MRSKKPFRSLIVCVSCAMVGCILTSTAYSRRVNDLETERDIYASKSSNWERMAGERDETIDQLQTEVDKEEAEEAKKIERVKAKAEATLKTSKAKIAQAEAKELSGQMHRSEDVAAMTAELIYTIRGALMALPSRVAINAAALSDPAEVAEYMRGEVNQIAEEIALFRYDPAKYEARVRERRSWTEKLGGDEDE